jgi:hypothetical protein
MSDHQICCKACGRADSTARRTNLEKKARREVGGTSGGGPEAKVRQNPGFAPQSMVYWPATQEREFDFVCHHTEILKN